jgi:hypothetical protein
MSKKIIICFFLLTHVSPNIVLETILLHLSLKLNRIFKIICKHNVCRQFFPQKMCRHLKKVEKHCVRGYVPYGVIQIIRDTLGGVDEVSHKPFLYFKTPF